PAWRPDTIVSSSRYASNTGDMPTPHAAASCSRSTGTVLVRVIPLMSTHVSATATVPRPASRRDSDEPRAPSRARARASRSCPGTTGSGKCSTLLAPIGVADRGYGPEQPRTKIGRALSGQGAGAVLEDRESLPLVDPQR